MFDSYDNSFYDGGTRITINNEAAKLLDLQRITEQVHKNILDVRQHISQSDGPFQSDTIIYYDPHSFSYRLRTVINIKKEVRYGLDPPRDALIDHESTLCRVSVEGVRNHYEEVGRLIAIKLVSEQSIREIEALIKGHRR